MEDGAITEDVEEVVAVAAVDQAAMEEIAAATTPATTTTPTTPTPTADHASQGVRSASRWDARPLSVGIDSMSPMCRTVEVHLLP